MIRYDSRPVIAHLSLDSCSATVWEASRKLVPALKNTQGLSYNVNRTRDYYHCVVAGKSAGALPGAFNVRRKNGLRVAMRGGLLDLFRSGRTRGFGMGQNHFICQGEQDLSHFRNGFVAHGPENH